MFIAREATDGIPYILKYDGEGAWMLGTHYGHQDPSAEINAFTLIQNRSEISPEARHKIVDTNPRTLYRL
jgi:hypothetical protein